MLLALCSEAATTLPAQTIERQSERCQFPTQLPNGLDEVDVIIAGGGTAACVVAGRLAAANPSLAILVIEGGQDNFENSNVVSPGLFSEHLRPGSETAIS